MRLGPIPNLKKKFKLIHIKLILHLQEIIIMKKYKNLGLNIPKNVFLNILN